MPDPPKPPDRPKPPTREDVLNYKGHLCNLFDRSGKVIWTPALPGASDALRAEWLNIISAAGGTHVPIGAFTPGEVYPGIGIVNPDWTHNAAAIRGLLLLIIERGMVPVVFLDGGDPDPKPRMTSFLPVAAEAMHGLWDSVLTLMAWEPVVGGWRSEEVSWALTTWHQMAPQALIGYHGSPTRLVGSSNPIEPDDPWQGGEADFYTSHGGQHINIAMYQTPHGDDLYRPCTCPRAAEKFGHEDGCWLNRFEDYVARIGAGYHGWRKLPIALFEVCAYEFFRYQVTEQQCREVVTMARSVYDKWAVPFHWGNGAPL